MIIKKQNLYIIIMPMELLNIEDLKKSKFFLENIRWDITPRLFVDPTSAGPGKTANISHGYMFYVDLINDRPALVVMQLKYAFSKTVGYIYEIPEDLLRESMRCEATECIVGMYPVTGRLVDWLKKAFGISES
jgi:hypothetical protein